ncbi:MAG TPA: hypothetical protein VOA64_18725 [Candidatus Dormibacteraeota bacterium]|nr:hypothetical protein [Candidatus Dormibacteraeota bacterium]
MAATNTQVAGIAVQTRTQIKEERNVMGANRTQAVGIVTFLLAFTALSGAIYSGKVVWYLAALALLAISIVFFRKCKPWENQEN